ncbi:MAG TPA: potassium channel protein [Candidatus Krumholzibacteria bacterium]|nr:potassium channel protein [Candidatus Krumholzibacteria bacterium]HRX50492.1 potassium channel protein [Candidatus Krumholzibacteria bacterium]
MRTWNDPGPEGNRYGHVVTGSLLLLATIVLGSVGFMLIERFTPLEALYMTMITISTVGFGEVHSLSPMGRVFVIVLIVVGLGLVTYTAGSLAGLFFEGQLRKLVGRRMMQRELDGLRDHFIVCGYGRMGRIICEELAEEGKPFVVITLDQEEAERLREAGLLAIGGDATEDEVLLNAGVTRARALTATAGSDVDNLYIVLSSRELSRKDNPGLYILARAADEKAGRKILRAGADRCLSPYRIGGSRLVQALLRPKVYDFMEAVTSRSGLELMVEEFQVCTGSRLVGHAIRDTNLRTEYDVIIIGLNAADGRQVFNPGPDQVIQADDTLILLGRTPQLQRLERDLKG